MTVSCNDASLPAGWERGERSGGRLPWVNLCVALLCVLKRILVCVRRRLGTVAPCRMDSLVDVEGGTAVTAQRGCFGAGPIGTEDSRFHTYLVREIKT